MCILCVLINYNKLIYKNYKILSTGDYFCRAVNTLLIDTPDKPSKRRCSITNKLKTEPGKQSQNFHSLALSEKSVFNWCTG